jgi:hypothetical protein
LCCGEEEWEKKGLEATSTSPFLKFSIVFKFKFASCTYTTQAALPPGDKDRTGWGHVLIGLFGSLITV